MAAQADARAGVDSSELGDLLEAHWLSALERGPQWASELGFHIADDRLGRADREFELEGRTKRAEFLKRARAIDPKQISSRDRVTLGLLLEELEAASATEVCEFAQWNLMPRSNPLTQMNNLADMHRVESWDDARNLVARYRQLAPNIDATVAQLRTGAESGAFSTAESARRVAEMVRRELDKERSTWPLLAPAAKEHPEWSEAERALFSETLRAIVDEEVAPALARYADFIEAEVLPKARAGDRSGIVHLPQGEACYRGLIRTYTTLDRSPKEIHEIGLAEIKKIDAEFVALGKELFEEKKLGRILERLRTDPELYFKDEQEVEDFARATLAEAKEAMPDFFGVLPQADCIVVPIPDYEAPYTTIAYYRPTSPDGSKPGEYFINSYAPTTRPRYEARVLALHESIPGHHLQIAISQELDAVPAFRKYGGQTVFVEGWALYTERMGLEMGLYPEPLDRMGIYSFDAWRAGRLVVDTGIHALGWSREEAVDFLTEHTALAANNIDNEVDRYVSWPGQALAYKTGQLEIWRLRHEAERELGANFKLSSFHDAVLGGGAVSVPVLEKRVRAWVESAR